MDGDEGGRISFIVTGLIAGGDSSRIGLSESVGCVGARGLYVKATSWRRRCTHAKYDLDFATLNGVGSGGPEAKAYLLCAECEERFNRNGESPVFSWIAPKALKYALPLLRRLRESSPRAHYESHSRFSGRDIGIDTDAFAYFALSFVGRAAVAEWPLPDGGLTMPLDLGTFEEPIGRYLMGETGLPPNIAVLVCVGTDEESRRSQYIPAPSDDQSLNAFGFLVRGVYFGVFLDPNLPDVLRDDSCTSPFKAIFLMNRRALTIGTFERMVRRHVGT